MTNLFTFPIFMFSYIPITVAALFLKVDWVPTQHAVSVTLDEVMQGAKYLQSKPPQRDSTFVVVFAFELLPKEVFDNLYPVLDLHLCWRGD